MMRKATISSRWREQIYRALFDINTHSGRRMEFFWIGIACASVLLVFIESGQPLMLQAIADSYGLYIWLELLFTALFTLEYLLRVLSTPRDQRYPFSFLGIIDLITTLPFYILLIWPGAAIEYIYLFRLLRVLRVLRILKLLRYMSAARLLWDSIMATRKKLFAFFGFIFILLCIFAGLMYVVEGPDNGFTNLPVSVYWAVVTMTTVGYGDIVPHTVLGRILASLLILIGYSTIAVPTGILTAYMTNILGRQRKTRICRSCHSRDHDDEAAFCKHCGAKLTEEKDGEAE